MSNKISLLIVTVVAVVGAILVYYIYDNGENQEINKFANEYTLVDKEHVFVYKDLNEIINVLEGGTGIIYLGFPECPWCQRYVKYLNEVAKENGVEEIYYYNIKSIRDNNTEEYKKIVSLLNKHLLKDDEGNSRVFVPDLSFVKNGKIVAHDNETSVTDLSNPDEYWSDEQIDIFKNKIKQYISDYKGVCTSCN